MLGFQKYALDKLCTDQLFYFLGIMACHIFAVNSFLKKMNPQRGKLFDWLKSYVPTFITGGVLYVISYFCLELQERKFDIYGILTDYRLVDPEFDNFVATWITQNVSWNKKTNVNQPK